MDTKLLIDQILAIIWKNVILRTRSVGSIFLEIGLPLLLCLGVILVNISTGSEKHPFEIYYPSKLELDKNKPIFCMPEIPALVELLSSANPEYYNFTFVKSFEKLGEPLHGVQFFLDNENQVPKELKFRAVTTTGYENNEIYGTTADHLNTGVSYVQYAVTRNFVEYWHRKNRADEHLSTEEMFLLQMPKPAFEKSSREIIVELASKSLFAFFFGFVCITTMFLTEEKETKIKESMKLIGMSSSAYWSSWFISRFMDGALICFIFALSFRIGGVLNSSPILIFIFLIFYVVDIISFAFMLSCFIKTSKTAALFSIIIFVVLTIISPASFPFLHSWLSSHIFASILFQSATYRFADIFKRKEILGSGIHIDELHSYDVVPYLSLIDVLIMFVTNTLFNFFIVWYMDNIDPGEYGVPKPYLFFLTKDYWSPSTAPVMDIPEMPPQDLRYFEVPPTNKNVGIQIRNLMKMFDGVIVVADTNLDLYQDQITVLLGHNGAGKTTTINMITGFLKPTRGTVVINGYDINKNLNKARQNLGLCPQHEVLFPNLTCMEHLIFFTKLKGKYHKLSSDKEFNVLLEEFELKEKSCTLTKLLSGGQKRKLSVLCAFVGDNKTIFLDEPSSGLDPSARRAMWTFLQNRRAGNTILLTTHYMDEADMLGDRIVIMAEGVVKCYGTPNFLKRIYGTGYQMTVVKISGCNVDKITKAIQEYIIEASILSQTNLEVTYFLPDNKMHLYAPMLQMLEKNKEKLNFSSYGMACSSMEDVFVKVGLDLEPKSFVPEVAKTSPKSGADEQTAAVDVKDKRNSSRSSKSHSATLSRRSSASTTRGSQRSEEEESAFFEEMKDYTRLQSSQLFKHQVQAIITKKKLIVSRNKLSFIAVMLLPLVLTSASIYGDMRLTNRPQSEPIFFTLDHFTKDLVFHAMYTKSKPSETLEYFQGFADITYGSVIRHFISYSVIDSIKETYKWTSVEPTKDVISLAAGHTLLKYIDQIGKDTYKSKHLFGVMETDRPKSAIAALYQENVVHSQGIALQLLLNAWVKRYLGVAYSVQTGVQHQLVIFHAVIKQFQIISMLSLGISLIIVPAWLTYSLIQERAIGGKHLQSISGVNPLAYWLGNFAFDYVLYLIVMVEIMLAFLIYPDFYLSHNRWMVTLTVLIVYGMTIYPYMYAVQVLFKQANSGVSAIMIVGFFVGDIASSIMTVLKTMFSMRSSSAFLFFDVLFTLATPNYTLKSFFFNLMMLAASHAAFKREISFADYLTTVVGSSSLYEGYWILLGLTLFFWTIILISDFHLLRLVGYLLPEVFQCIKLSSVTAHEDDDVITERQMIARTPLNRLLETYTIVMKELCKKYYFSRGKFLTAVYGTSIAVSRKECLGLLGQNGAGKTTTFKMLTGDISVTFGDAYLSGFSIKYKIKKIQAMIGYCPQHDALNDLLTGRETLFLYGSLRGVPTDALPAVSQAVIDFVTLAPHEDKLTKHYSGGTKRKLAVGIAIIGDPKFVMLDEPTAGMDPMARRALWSVLGKIRASGKTLVLTSHSMEECEALCTRMAIMAHGRLLCLGSSEHLKNKFGKGYTVVLHAGKDNLEKFIPLEPVEQYLLGKFPDSEVFSHQDAYSEIRVSEKILVSFIFETLEKAKAEFKFEHYTAQQASLEQVFLSFM